MAAAQWPHSGLRSDFVWKTKWKANLSEILARFVSPLVLGPAQFIKLFGRQASFESNL